MRPILFFVALVMLCSSRTASAQYTVQVPADARIISSDSVISLNPGGPGVNHSFLVCAGKKLKLNGISTYMVRLYMEENATMDFDTMAFSLYLVGDYFMKQNSMLDFNKHMGSPIDTMMVQNTVTVLDTQTILPSNPLPCTTLVFDYSLLPGGVSPCPSVPLSVHESAEAGLVIPSPVADRLNFATSKSGHFSLHDGQGRVVRQVKLDANSRADISLQGLAPGMYFYILRGERSVAERGKLMIR